MDTQKPLEFPPVSMRPLLWVKEAMLSPTRSRSHHVEVGIRCIRGYNGQNVDSGQQGGYNEARSFISYSVANPDQRVLLDIFVGPDSSARFSRRYQHYRFHVMRRPFSSVKLKYHSLDKGSLAHPSSAFPFYLLYNLVECLPSLPLLASYACGALYL